MTDLIGDALRKKEATERERAQKQNVMEADAISRARDLAEKAKAAMLGSVDGIATLPKVSGDDVRVSVITIDGRPTAEAIISVNASGPELNVVLEGHVGWSSGDGFNVGLGLIPAIHVTVTRKRDRRSADFKYPVNNGVSISGNYGIDPVSMQMKIIAAIDRL
jgi:hypothetical protein